MVGSLVVDVPVSSIHECRKCSPTVVAFDFAHFDFASDCSVWTLASGTDFERAPMVQAAGNHD